MSPFHLRLKKQTNKQTKKQQDNGNKKYPIIWNIQLYSVLLFFILQDFSNVLQKIWMMI